MIISKPSWVFFDIDDTLWNFEANSLKSLEIIYQSYNLLSNLFNSFESFSEEYHNINSHLWSLYNHGEISSSLLKTERFRLLIQPHLTNTASQYNINTLSIEQLCSDLNRHYLDTLAEMPLLNDGAIEMLKEIQPYFLLGALTNGFADVQYKKIYNTGISRFLQRMIVSDETPWQKPDVNFFRFAENAVGAKPIQCLLVGDNIETDIAGAKKAGWQYLHYDKTGNGDISSLYEIPAILLSLPGMRK